MQLPLFYQETLTEDTGDFTLSSETSKHIVQVLRMKAGDEFILTDGKGSEMTVKLKVADKQKGVATFESRTNHLARDYQIAIAISPVKNPTRFEWFVEKATEIGVTEIIPILCKRTEKNKLRRDRLQNIMISAMLQSRQSYCPVLKEEIKIEELLTNAAYDQKFIATLERDNADLKSLLIANDSKIILIGPEGDFTPEEIESFLKVNFLPVSLGNTRLRTETAGVVAAVLLKDSE